MQNFFPRDGRSCLEGKMNLISGDTDKSGTGGLCLRSWINYLQEAERQKILADPCICITVCIEKLKITKDIQKD